MSVSVLLKTWREWRRFSALEDKERRVVFYCEDGASLAHLGPLVTRLTEAHGLSVCYLASSAADPWLAAAPPGVRSFYIGEGVVRTMLFSGLRTEVMVMTMPDLETFYLKRSRAREVHYVYVFHSMVSTHMIYRHGAFDHYDTLLCAGPHHIEEVRRAEKVYGLKPKTLVEHGYARLDELLSARPSGLPELESIRRVLVAPSWGERGLLETRGEELITVLLDAGYRVVLRPHPITLRRRPRLLDLLRRRFPPGGDLSIETDIKGSDSFFNSDVMISDWSGAALEYAFARQRPVLFVDVPRKVNNPEYLRLGLEPVEVSLRDKIGVVVGADRIADIPVRLRGLEDRLGEFRENIGRLRTETVYNAGQSASIGASYIAGLLNK